MEYEIRGTVMPQVEVRLLEGESVYTEKGGMAWMDDEIEMDTNVRGGLGGAMKRMFSKESIFRDLIPLYRGGREGLFYLKHTGGDRAG